MVGNRRSVSFTGFVLARYAGQYWAGLERCDVVTVGQALQATATSVRRYRLQQQTLDS